MNGSRLLARAKQLAQDGEIAAMRNLLAEHCVKSQVELLEYDGGEYKGARISVLLPREVKQIQFSIIVMGKESSR